MPSNHITTIAIDVDALTAGDVVYREHAPTERQFLTVESVTFDTGLAPCVVIDGCRKDGMWVVRYEGHLHEYFADGCTAEVVVDDPDPEPAYTEVAGRYGTLWINNELLEARL